MSCHQLTWLHFFIESLLTLTRSFNFRNGKLDFIFFFIMSFLFFKSFPSLSIRIGFLSEPSQFFLVHFLESLEFLYFFHSFIQELPLFDNLVPLILESLILSDHGFPLFFQLLILIPQALCLFLLLTESSLNIFPFPLQLFLLFNQFKVVFSFLLNLSFLFFKFFLFLDQLFSFAIQLFPLSFCVAYRLKVKPDVFHFLLDHVAYARGLTRFILFKPAASHVKKFLHMVCTYCSKIRELF